MLIGSIGISLEIFSNPDFQKFNSTEYAAGATGGIQNYFSVLKVFFVRLFNWKLST